MQNKHFVFISLIILPFVALTSRALIGSNKLKPEAALVETVREATAQYQRTPGARAAGYDLVIGFHYCLENYGVGGMGYHYINTDFLDTTVNLLHPEAIIYAPDRNGSIQLAAVEYMVPAAAWDAAHTEPPQIQAQSFHLQEKMGMCALHVWIGKDNPSGSFEDWNPDVSCPTPLKWDGPMCWR